MQFNISFKTIFEYILKKLVLCIQIRFVSTEKTTRIASRASCLDVQCAFWYRQRRVDIEEDIEDCVSRKSVCNRYYNERECNKYKIQTL